MSSRHLSLLDRCITELDHALRVVAAEPVSAAAAPEPETMQSTLSAQEKALSARLMRVNHSGEVAAQALYRGQALVARSEAQRLQLLNAAEDENDHLAWCEHRTRELGSNVSVMSPGWYLGSFAIGMAAGLAGDRISLGFLAETERQVAEHLDGHLARLPESDAPSRAILTRMREDEIRHGTAAEKHGASELPGPIKRLMRGASMIMTTLSYRL